jgi:hypothetical protein
MLRSMMLALAGALCTTFAMAAPAYRLDIVKSEDGVYPRFMRGLNQQGDLAGSARGLQPHPHQYHLVKRGSDGVVTELEDSRLATLKDLNDHGDVLGLDSAWKAVIWWNEGERQVLEDLSWVYAMNNQGQVVGTSQGKAVIYDAGVLTELATVDGNAAVGEDINDRRMVAGSATWFADGQYHTLPALWDEHGTLKLLQDAGTGTALAINAQGQATGFGERSGGFFFDGVAVVPLSTPEVSAIRGVALNDRGEVLEDAERGLALWRGGKAWYLRTFLADGAADWSTMYGERINNAGQILGWGLYKGKYRSFVASPVTRD